MIENECRVINKQEYAFIYLLSTEIVMFLNNGDQLFGCKVDQYPVDEHNSADS